MKVVINKCFGGFSISLEAARFMAERGNKVAKAEVYEYDAKAAGDIELNEIEEKSCLRWYGYGYAGGHDGYSRNDQDLVAAVQQLGKKASGRMANLEVVEIPDGVEWEIDEYDGLESVAEKHRTWG